jgi:hypothetical protein
MKNVLTIERNHFCKLWFILWSVILASNLFCIINTWTKVVITFTQTSTYVCWLCSRFAENRSSWSWRRTPPRGGSITCITYFGLTCLTCVIRVRCEGLKLSLCWIASKWVIECAICDEPRAKWDFAVITLYGARQEHMVAPPLAPQPDNRVVISPCGDMWVSRTLVLCFNYKFDFNLLTFLYMCRSWIDSVFDGTSKQRLVNQVLGNMCRLHYPGMVTLSSGEHEITTTCEHFWYAPNGDYETA